MSHKESRGALSLAEAVRNAYALGQTDYYLEPLVRVDDNGQPVGRIQSGDTVVFCCRRGEREIILTEMFTDPAFDGVPLHHLKDLNFVILTLYHEKFLHLPVAFQPSRIDKPLAQILSEAGRSQLHCAESEKFAHVTFFFNGGNNTPYPGEESILVPSPKGIPFTEKPELSLPELVDSVSARLGEHDFVLVNFANGDIIGHTADRDAKLSAAGHVSSQLERLITVARERDYVIAITADHGNLETMTTPDGKPDMAHTRNPVPFVLIDPRRTDPIPVKDGSLCDVAPTILSIMGVPSPAEMTGKNLAGASNFGPHRKVLLVILDGWGLGARDATDAIFMGDTPYWDKLIEKYPPSMLRASDGFVGLGEGKPGNSEAGHLNLGAGRIILQDDVRLDKAILNNTFSENDVLKKAIRETRESGQALHLLSFLTHKSSHGSIEYALAVLRMAKELPQVYLHIIFDGRSTPTGSAPDMLVELERQLDEIGAGQVVGGVGRGIVLERDKHYEKIKRGYDAMVLGKGTTY